MEKEILKTIAYFAYFNYPPTETEIYTFLKKKSNKDYFKKILKNMIQKGKVIFLNDKAGSTIRYTLPQYSIKTKNWQRRRRNSQEKLNDLRFKLYLKLLSFFPQIKLIGLSGSLAMMNSKRGDDIDLFIISSADRLFTARLLALMLAQILGIRRKRGGKRNKNKVCLNLFFDEKNLEVPATKKTFYVAHEILQMKPIINKNYTYERFLYANRWVVSFFPNAAKISNFKFLISNQFQILKFKNYKLNKNLKLKIKNLSDWIETQLKKFQLKLIKKHQTTELITDTQLWFHPDDFGKKLQRLTGK